ncbi:class I SAM-dependent methyltransferase [Massilia sp. S19_KUP03_FR1]|uniref:class I SAM-dependent methyltransferase n=1 Tax=Massilia sp. S19_KUP03_FR1 TaxID=3025503 RepID=UPI002FCD798B
MPTLISVWLLARAGFHPSYASAAVIQGLLAALVTRWRGLAAWWLPIQCLFPLALLGAHALALPSWLFLTIFMVLLAVFWSTFRTQVPYWASGARVWRAVAELLPAGRPLKVIDIGSGLGGFTLDLARRRPDATLTGVELAPLPWFVSWLRAALTASRARFVRGDYESFDFADFDVVFCYLSPAAMPALYAKCLAEMKTGSKLMSYEFVIAERTPDLVIPITHNGASLYVWDF